MNIPVSEITDLAVQIREINKLPPRKAMYEFDLIRGKVETAINYSIAIIQTYAPKPRNVPVMEMPEIIQAVATAWNTTPLDIMSKKRRPSDTDPRFAAYLLGYIADHSYAHIGRSLGGRDHSTIFHGVGTAIGHIQFEADYKDRFFECTKLLGLPVTMDTLKKIMKDREEKRKATIEKRNQKLALAK